MVKKVLKILVLVLAAGFIIIQFFQIDKSNPPIDPAQTLEATTHVPPDVDMILTTSCNDCHTNKTIYPWYSYIQPSGWFLNNHITDGRRRLNFSVWNTYNLTKKKDKMEEVCDQVTDASMPLPSYLWIHGNAVLSKTQVETLCTWSKAEADKLRSQSPSDDKDK